MKNNMKIKDVLLVALLTAVYLIFFFGMMMAIMPLGALGHAISPGFIGLVGGTVLYFMSRKVGKMWQFSLSSLLVMGVFTFMGSGYLPWFASVMLMSILADLMASRSNRSNVFVLAITSGLIHVGHAWGAIIPAALFTNKYREDWIARGQTPEAMDEMIKYTAGQWALYSTIIVFVMGFIGIFIGYMILRKHFKEGRQA